MSAPDAQPPAGDERVPPLTAQQLGLCGPLSDDPGVGPDAARHTPPADDQAEQRVVAAACRVAQEWNGERMGHGAMRDGPFVELSDALVAYGDAVEEFAAVGPAEAAEPAHSLDVWERDTDDWRWRCSCGVEAWRSQPTAEAATARGSAHAQAAEAGAPEPTPAGVHDVMRLHGIDPATYVPAVTSTANTTSHTQTVIALPDPHDGDTCADMDRWLDDAQGELNDISMWLVRRQGVHVKRPDGEYDYIAAIREAIDKARAGSDTTAPDRAALALIDDLLRPWAYGYPVNPGYAGRAAQYVSVETVAGWNARRAALASAAASRVEPALIGTWADPEFQAHADHKHAVDGCGYCPSEEDR